MVKVVAIVGGKRSGKTTVIQCLTRELRRRGYSVGLVKEMSGVNWIDILGKEMWKYGEAGAEIMAGVAINETVLFIKRKLNLMELAAFFTGFDYLLLEGFEDEKAVVRVIAAKNAAEAQEFYNDLTIAISGIIAECKEEAGKALMLGVPIFNCMMETEKLADVVEKKALPLFPNLRHCGECGYGSCRELAKAIVAEATNLRECPLLRKEDVILEVNGRVIPLKSFPSLFIKGTIIGMISSLNGIGQAKEIKIMVKVI
ncbi:MAG: molybdopterin-guanine dinucleotide biosynthesis protein MobB [Candidatus Bathyarchaeia archaeon]